MRPCGLRTAIEVALLGWTVVVTACTCHFTGACKFGCGSCGLCTVIKLDLLGSTVVVTACTCHFTGTCDWLWALWSAYCY